MTVAESHRPAVSAYPSPLAAYLATRGISQRKLIEMTGLPSQTINGAYHGRKAYLDTYLTIARALDCPLGAIAPEQKALLDGIDLS